MDSVEALHHAARQYCLERSVLWNGRYSQLGIEGRVKVTGTGTAWKYSVEAYSIFPRFQTLAAIKNEIERFLPGDFASLGECRSMLALAGETANNPFTRHIDPTAIAADLDERRKFSEFVLSVDEARLSQQARLPFRRVLGIDEHKNMHDAVVQNWGEWYGGQSDRTPAHGEVVTLSIAAMDGPESYPRLREALREHGVVRLFELREWGDGYEIPVESADFNYDGAEGFWTSGDLDWLVYASHESSITFGSAWLVDKMRSALPEFERYIYKGWDLAAYASL